MDQDLRDYEKPLLEWNLAHPHAGFHGYHQKHSKWARAVRTSFIIAGSMLLFALLSLSGSRSIHWYFHSNASPPNPVVVVSTDDDWYEHFCPQVSKLEPSNEFLSGDPTAYINDDGNHDKLITRLSEAVKIPTVAYDNMTDPELSYDDDLYKPFVTFGKFLNESFPSVRSNLTRTPINTHGILLEWTGSEPTMQPLLLLAHMDVVPVIDDQEWVGGNPFSGLIMDNTLWGRGSVDD